MRKKIIHLTDSSFHEDVLESKVPIVVDFWADWCSPCKRIASFLEEVAIEFLGKINIAKLNIDHNPVTSKKYGIRSIPTMIFFKNGKIIATKVGAISQMKMKSFLKTYL